MHTVHPDVHEHGLADGCEACTYHADTLHDLDKTTFSDLVDRTLRNRFGTVDGDSPFGTYVAARSDTEAVAMANVMTLLERVGKVAENAPSLLALYLSERWRVGIVAVDDFEYARRENTARLARART